MIIMQLDPIDGDCGVSGYTNWITLDDCSFELAREPKESNQTGTQDLQLGMPECGPVNMKKTVDKASVYLMQLGIGGGALGKDSKCTIVWLQTGMGENNKAKFDKYMEVELTRPVLKKYSIDASGNDRATENIELMYSKISMKYFQRDPKTGAPNQIGPKGWDLVSGEPC